MAKYTKHTARMYVSEGKKRVRLLKRKIRRYRHRVNRDQLFRIYHTIHLPSELFVRKIPFERLVRTTVREIRLELPAEKRE